MNKSKDAGVEFSSKSLSSPTSLLDSEVWAGAFVEEEKLLWLRRYAKYRARQRLGSGSLQAAHQSIPLPREGVSLDYREVRDYHFHDEVRHIDWKITARCATPHVRTYHQETDATYWVLLNQASPLFFGSQIITKSTAAAYMAIFVLYLLRHFASHVGLICLNDKGMQVYESSKVKLLEMIERILQHNHALSVDSVRACSLADYHATWRATLRLLRQKPRTAVYGFSEMTAWSSALNEEVGAVSRRQAFYLNILKDSMESEEGRFFGSLPVVLRGHHHLFMESDKIEMAFHVKHQMALLQKAAPRLRVNSYLSDQFLTFCHQFRLT